ncbi:MAG: type II toxin-antitoxin system RelE/ParE family toxin [Gammaproteobacteria bacterium]|nr:type II toxin-antitoxin system RelE/ParE family toxin [Gammaproteobacteria bacterium]
MAWEIEFKPSARKIFDKLDRSIQKKVLKFLNTKIAPLKDPRVFGKPLQYEQYGLWRYRVEDYRIICQIDDGTIKIVVVKVGHRRDIYDE